ncbi:hypothetical protein ACFY12_03155 [Streptomyces sp. NPDC001339]
MTVRTVLVWPWNPPRLAELPIDGDRTRLVRPYYLAYEQQPQPVEVVW